MPEIFIVNMFQISIQPEEIDKLKLAAFDGKITVIDKPGSPMQGTSGIYPYRGARLGDELASCGHL